MAKTTSTVTKKTVVVEHEVEVPTFTLVLSSEEAEYVMRLLGRLNGKIPAAIGLPDDTNMNIYRSLSDEWERRSGGRSHDRDKSRALAHAIIEQVG